MDCKICDVKKDGGDCFSCHNDDLCESNNLFNSLKNDYDQRFIDYFNVISSAVHQNAVNKKWWDKPREPGTAIANIHGEVSEAWEGYRHGNPPSDKIPEFSSVEEELADVIIRIMDIAGGHNMRVAEALVAKMAYNSGREERHGGKLY